MALVVVFSVMVVDDGLDDNDEDVPFAKVVVAVVVAADVPMVNLNGAASPLLLPLPNMNPPVFFLFTSPKPVMEAVD